MAGSGDLYAAMREFFEVCLAALDDTPDGRPECAYLSPGPPSWDTFPCLIVHAGGPAIAETSPTDALGAGHRIALASEVNLVGITATVLRCAPQVSESGELPSVAAFDAATLQSTSDLWAIWNHVRQAKKDGTLFAPTSRELFLDPAVAQNQEGGACGWQVPIRTQLDGYRPS